MTAVVPKQIVVTTKCLYPEKPAIRMQCLVPNDIVTTSSMSLQRDVTVHQLYSLPQRLQSFVVFVTSAMTVARLLCGASLSAKIPCGECTIACQSHPKVPKPRFVAPHKIEERSCNSAAMLQCALES